MRLFVALDLPEPVKDHLEALRRDIPGAKWVQRPAFHLTLRFLGDGIAPERLTTLTDALGDLHADAFTWSLRGVGTFPAGGKRPPRVLWAGVDAPPALAALYAALETPLANAGFPPEARPFNPHVTLARLRSPLAATDDIDRFLNDHARFGTASFPATAVTLYESRLGPQGARYSAHLRTPLRS